MAWLVYGDDFSTSEMTNTAKFQPVTFGQDTVLVGIRTWIIIYNDPPFTSLNMKIYSNDATSGQNTPKKLLATSTNVQLKSAIHTLANGVKEIWFDFDYPVYNGADVFNLVINGVGYTGSVSSHIAWMKAFPNPVYSSGYTPSMLTIPYAPYEGYFIGATL
jgi:hypothetical protein